MVCVVTSDRGLDPTFDVMSNLPSALHTAGVSGDPALDLAVTHALLRAVAERRRGDAIRVYHPGPTAAFGRLDVLRPGFARACAVAREHGLEPVIRPAGGHAAPYGPDAVIVEHVTREQDVTAGLQARFQEQAGLLRDVLAGLGADARIGELRGEYCPGAYSVNVGGRLKVAGVAQRAIRGAALTTAVLTVTGGPALRAAIAAVYAALDLAVDPAAAGALDEAVPGVTPDAVAARVVAAYGHPPAAALDAELLDAARALADRHRVP
jgi:lipoate-protein ligase A